MALQRANGYKTRKTIHTKILVCRVAWCNIIKTLPLKDFNRFLVDKVRGLSALIGLKCPDQPHLGPPLSRSSFKLRTWSNQVSEGLCSINGKIVGLACGIVVPDGYRICCYCLLLVLWGHTFVVSFAYIAFSLSLKI